MESTLIRRAGLVLLTCALWLELGQQVAEFGGRELFADFRDFRRGKRVAPLVQRMAGAALEPPPANLMSGGYLVQTAPEIVVLDWLFVRRLPAARFPSRDPTRDAFAQIFGVREALDFAAFFEATYSNSDIRPLDKVVNARHRGNR
jgi:hypothetical protein